MNPKDHVLREVVNSLRDIAIEFHGACQLRARLRNALVPLLGHTPMAGPDDKYMRGLRLDGDTTLAGNISMINDEIVQATLATKDGANRAAADVIAERRRQVAVEGWTTDHDDLYSAGDLASAAACYATQGRLHNPIPGSPPDCWPFRKDWWKPSSYRRNLIKACALLLAEIERIDRAEIVASKKAGA